MFMNYAIYPFFFQLIVLSFTLNNINSILRSLLIVISIPWLIMQILFSLWLTTKNVRILKIQVKNIQSIKIIHFKSDRIKIYKLLFICSFVVLIKSISSYLNTDMNIDSLSDVTQINNYTSQFIFFIILLFCVLIFWLIEVKLVKDNQKQKLSKIREFNVWNRVKKKKIVLLLLLIFLSYNVIYLNIENYGSIENNLIVDNTNFAISFNNIPANEIYNFNIDKLIKSPEIKAISEQIYFNVDLESENYKIPLKIKLVNYTQLLSFECENCKINNISEIIPQDSFFTSNIVYDSFVRENIILTAPNNATKIISPDNIEIIQPENGFTGLRFSLGSTITHWNSLELNYPILNNGSFVSDNSDEINIYWYVIIEDEFSNLNEKEIQSIFSNQLGIETNEIQVTDKVKIHELSLEAPNLTSVSISNITLGVIIFLIVFFLIINTKEYYQILNILCTKYGINRIIKEQLILLNLIIFGFIIIFMFLSTLIAYFTVRLHVFNIYIHQGIIISSADIYTEITIKYLSIIIATYVPLSILSNILFYIKLKSTN